MPHTPVRAAGPRMGSQADYTPTPDRRYFVVRGRLWRLSNPSLDPDTHERLVRDLMNARRAIAQSTTRARADFGTTARRCGQASFGRARRPLVGGRCAGLQSQTRCPYALRRVVRASQVKGAFPAAQQGCSSARRRAEHNLAE